MKKLYRMSKRKKILLFTGLILALIILILVYSFMVYSFFAKNAFVEQAIQISDKNQDPVFKIKKVLLYSSAGVIDNSSDKSLKDLNISQFTDIAIYIDNKAYITDLTQKNTIKKLTVSNISISKDNQSGTRSLTYKSPLNFAKFQISEAAELYEKNDNEYAPIDYTIKYDNSENNTTPYVDPTFFTDCSDPITLCYLNKDVVTHYSLPDNSNMFYNGSLLKQSNVDLDTLSTVVSFNIDIINNENEKFTYNIKLNLSYSKDIYNGYLFQGKETSGDEFNFFKKIN